jgi:hypothetical protein
MKIISYYLLIIAILMTSCIKDKENPIITSLTFKSDKTPPEFNRGDTLFFSFTAEDNKALDRYTVKIIPESSSFSWNTNELYYFENSVTTSVEILEKEIFLPANINTGYYEFTLMVEDKKLNFTESTHQIKIVGDTLLPPSIIYENAPIQFTVFTPNDVIELSGTINNASQISTIQVFLVRTNDDLSNNEVSIYNSIVVLNETNLSAQAPYEFDSNIMVGAPKDNNSPPHIISNWDIGDCYLLVRVISNGIIKYGTRVNIIIND